MRSKILEYISPKCTAWSDDIIPTAADLKKLKGRFDEYQKNGKSAPYICTPWGLANSIKVPEKKLKHYFGAILIGWTELEKLLKNALKSDGYNAQEIKFFASKLLEKQADLDRALQTLNNEVTESLDNLEEDIEKHDTLNAKLFDIKTNKLKNEINNRIQEIVEEFTDELARNEIKINIKDIVIIGSNASYNYTKDSDLDVHILADTETLNCPDNLYPALYSAYRSIFNNKFDISFYKIPVELFVETEDLPTVSNGVYSVLKDEWVKQPIIETIPELDKEAFDKEYKIWEDKYLALEKDIKDEKETDENVAVELLEEIYALRSEGIKSDGEYSIGNLVFKELRNKGLLDKLKDFRNELVAKRLSIEESLNRRALDNAAIEIKRATFYSTQIQNNGYFIIHNVSENEVNSVLAKLKRLDYVEYAKVGAPGRFDFSKQPILPGQLPSRYYTINGKIKDEEEIF